MRGATWGRAPYHFSEKERGVMRARQHRAAWALTSDHIEGGVAWGRLLSGSLTRTVGHVPPLSFSERG